MGSKGSQTTTTTNSPDPRALQAYADLLNRAQGVAATPYQPYSKELVAPVNPQQQTGIADINQYAGYALPYIGQAAGLATASATPVTAQDIQTYVSPYTLDVVKATQAQFADQNARQAEQIRANAAAQGALGGDREAVAQALLANEQQLAQAPVIAGLENQGYTTALNTALTEKQMQGQGAYSLGNLGVSGENAMLTGANAKVGAGSLEQQIQQAADLAAYQQWVNQQAFPYQQTQWLAGIDTGVGSQMGGTGTTTGPAPSQLGQIMGGLTSGVSILGGSGAFGPSGWLARALASGGAVPDAADGVANRDLTVPETARTLWAQQQQLLDGHRRVQMFPNGTPELPLPRGMRRTHNEHGVFHYDPQRIGAEEIHHLSDNGRENEFLDLGPHSKHDVMTRLARGERPVAVVERTPDGTEVRAAAGTDTTAAAQFHAMNQAKSPGNIVTVEDPRHTLGRRLRRAQGGVVPSFDLGGATPYGAQPLPYGAAMGFVPMSQITRGRSMPSAPALPQGVAPDLVRQAAQVGSLANVIQKSSAGRPLSLAPPSPGLEAADQTPDYMSSSPLGGGNANAIYHRGGAVGRYAAGGIANLPPRNRIEIPIGYDDGGTVPVIDDQTTTAPAGVVDDRDLGAWAAPTIPVTPDGVATVVAPQQVVDEQSVPLPRARPATGAEPISAETAGLYTAPTSGYQDRMTQYGHAIGDVIESGGHYGALGNVTNSGDRAYGKYQVMGTNIGPWTEEVLGARMTPAQFLADPQAQDAVFRTKFGQYVNKYGPEGAARAWFAGEHGMNNLGASDVNGMTVGEYGRRFSTAAGLGNGVTNAAVPEMVTDLSARERTAAPSGVAPTSGIDLSSNSKLWPALMAAGFGMMASRSPFPGVAIGEGALTGMQAYQQEKAQEQQRTLKQSEIDLQVKRLAQEADLAHERLALQTRPYSEMTAAEKATHAQQEAALAETTRQHLLENMKPVQVGIGPMGPIYAIRDPRNGGYRVIDPETGRPGQPISAGPNAAAAAPPAPSATTPPGTFPPPQPGQPTFKGIQPSAPLTPAPNVTVPTQPVSTVPSEVDPAHFAPAQYVQTADGFREDAAAPLRGIFAADQLSTDGLNLDALANDPYLKNNTGLRNRILAVASGRSPMPPTGRTNPINQYIANKAYEVNPALDLTTYQRRQRAANYFAVGTQNGGGQNIVAMNRFLAHAGSLLNLAENIDSSRFPTINKFRNYMAKQGLLDRNLQNTLGAWEVNRTALAGEAAKVFAGSTTALADREEWMGVLSPDTPLATMRAKIKQAAEMSEQALNANVAQYNEGMRTNHRPQEFLTPRSRQLLDAIENNRTISSLNAAPSPPAAAAPAVAPRTLGAADQQALSWAKANPNDPRAATIMKRLGVQ